MKWVALFFIIIFLWQGYLFADYESEMWVFVYSVWDKTKDLILVLALISVLRRRFDSRQLIASYKVLALFLVCRIIWEIVCIALGDKINNPLIIEWLFHICWVCVVYILFYPAVRRILFKIGIWIDCAIMAIKHWWEVRFKH